MDIKSDSRRAGMFFPKTRQNSCEHVKTTIDRSRQSRRKQDSVGSAPPGRSEKTIVPSGAMPTEMPGLRPQLKSKVFISTPHSTRRAARERRAGGGVADVARPVVGRRPATDSSLVSTEIIYLNNTLTHK